MNYQLACLHLWFYLLESAPLLFALQYKEASTNVSVSVQPESKNFKIASSYFVLSSLWLFFIIIFIGLKYFHSEEMDKIKEIFDDCSSVNSVFRYLIKLRVGSATASYQRKKASIMIDFLTSQKLFITRIAVSPFWFLKDIAEEHQTSSQVVKMLLHRSHPIAQVGFIRINHDSHYPLGGLIYVYSLTVRDLGQNIITFIPIYSKIKPNLPDDSPDEQVFQAKGPKFCNADHETYLGEVSPYLSNCEHLLFLFSFCSFNSLIAIFIPKFIKLVNPPYLINGLLSFSITLLVMTIFFAIYRFLIKRNYSHYHGCKPWSWIRLIFIYILLLNDCLAGLMSATFQANSNLSFWLLSNGISYLFIFLLYLAYFIYLYLIKSCNDEMKTHLKS